VAVDAAFLRILQTQAEGEGRECVVGALITDAAGRVFVQKRSATRRLFPGCWDIAGGHLEPGETLEQALVREIREETGWELARVLDVVDVFDWEMVEDGRTLRKRDFEFLVEVAGDLERPRLQESKVTEYRWISAEDLDILKENRSDPDIAVYNLVKQALTLKGDRR
jgi:8-oxo-dGTP pyrophosphatase MutT (NUDIX family)